MTANLEKTGAEHFDGENNDLAHLANQEEHEMGKIESIRKYPLAFLWSIYAVWCILLVSFENQAAGNIIGIPEFRKDFGYKFGTDYVLHADWQSAFQGGLLKLQRYRRCSWLRCHRRLARPSRCHHHLPCYHLCCHHHGIRCYHQRRLLWWQVPQWLCCWCSGFCDCVIYWRGTNYVNYCLSALAYTLGPFAVSLIVNETGTYDSRWAYRAVFCAQYGFAVVSTVFVFFMPESPWWLVSKGQQDRALKSLARLGSKGEEGQKRLAAINKTLEEIKAETEGATYFECFRKSNLRRTIISIAPLCIQSLSGIMFAASYSTYYMQLAGYTTSESFKLQIVQQAISMIGNIMSWYLVDRMGRRNLTFYGLLILTVILFVMAALATVATPGAIKGTVAMILLYCWWYNVTIGATAYTVLCEVSTSRLRVKTVAIGLAAQNALNMMWSFVLPFMFNPDKANMGAKVGFVFGGEELDEMFTTGVPARKFKEYKPDAQANGEAVKTAYDADAK